VRRRFYGVIWRNLILPAMAFMRTGQIAFFLAKIVDSLLGETGNKGGRVGDMNEWSLFARKVVICFTTRMPALQTTAMLACDAGNHHGVVALRSPTIRHGLPLGRHN